MSMLFKPRVSKARGGGVSTFLQQARKSTVSSIWLNYGRLRLQKPPAIGEIARKSWHDSCLTSALWYSNAKPGLRKQFFYMTILIRKCRIYSLKS